MKRTHKNIRSNVKSRIQNKGKNKSETNIITNHPSNSSTFISYPYPSQNLYFSPRILFGVVVLLVNCIIINLMAQSVFKLSNKLNLFKLSNQLNLFKLPNQLNFFKLSNLFNILLTSSGNFIWRYILINIALSVNIPLLKKSDIYR